VLRKECDRACFHAPRRRGNAAESVPSELITLAIIYGYLMETRIWVRVVLALSACRSQWRPTASHFWDRAAGAVLGSG